MAPLAYQPEHFLPGSCLYYAGNGSRLVVLGDDNEGIALVKAEQFEEKLSMAMSVLSKDIKE